MHNCHTFAPTLSKCLNIECGGSNDGRDQVLPVVLNRGATDMSCVPDQGHRSDAESSRQRVSSV